MIWPIGSKNLKSHASTVLIFKIVSYGCPHGKSRSNQSFNFSSGFCFIGFYQLWNVWPQEVWN
ncbi:hypothetical protein LINPERHAP2_LOCUS11655 [Linum perenne]